MQPEWKPFDPVAPFNDMNNLAPDLRFALGRMAKSRAFLGAVLSLALLLSASGANRAIFTSLDRSCFRQPDPSKDPNGSYLTTSGATLR